MLTENVKKQAYFLQILNFLGVENHNFLQWNICIVYKVGNAVQKDHLSFTFTF